jgi:hypothetical protein
MTHDTNYLHRTLPRLRRKSRSWRPRRLLLLQLAQTLQLLTARARPRPPRVWKRVVLLPTRLSSLRARLLMLPLTSRVPRSRRKLSRRDTTKSSLFSSSISRHFVHWRWFWLCMGPLPWRIAHHWGSQNWTVRCTCVTPSCTLIKNVGQKYSYDMRRSSYVLVPQCNVTM